MNTGVATLIDILRRASARITGQGIAFIAGAVRDTFANAAGSDKDKRSELVCWLIVVAAIVGTPFVDASAVFCGTSEFAKLASDLF